MERQRVRPSNAGARPPRTSTRPRRKGRCKLQQKVEPAEIAIEPEPLPEFPIYKKNKLAQKKRVEKELADFPPI